MIEVAVHHADPIWRARFEGLKLVPPDRLPEDTRAVIATALPRRVDVTAAFLRDGVPDPDRRRALRELGATSSIVVPLLRGSRVIGVLRLVMAESGRRYTDDDIPFARELGHHAAAMIERARLYQLAQAAVAARDNLLAIVTHDLRNYLSTIMVSAAMLIPSEEPARSELERRRVEAIQRAGTRMARLIDDLRDATMIETGQLTTTMSAEAPAALVTEAVATFEPQATSRSQHLTLHLDGELPDVWCDRERVLQVIANLIGNALKFTAAGGEIRVGASRMDGGVCIAVSDTGPGIPEAQLAHVFERHWWGGGNSRISSGLGLYIAKGIVAAHGGRIWVESEVGKGTTFRFTLPLTPPAAAA